MHPEEFISRCLDAACRALNRTNRVVGKRLEALRCAGMIFEGFSEPIVFSHLDNDFIVEFLIKDEMLMCSAEMSNPQCNYQATLVLSQQTNKVLTHWVCEDDSSQANHELVLLKVGTSDFLDIGEYVCR